MLSHHFHHERAKSPWYFPFKQLKKKKRKKETDIEWGSYRVQVCLEAGVTTVPLPVVSLAENCTLENNSRDCFKVNAEEGLEDQTIILVIS